MWDKLVVRNAVPKTLAFPETKETDNISTTYYIATY